MRRLDSLVCCVWMAVLLCCQLARTQELSERDYINRLYYTLYTPSANDEAAALVASKLGARFEGRVGELKTYYWISIDRSLEKRQEGEDRLIALFKLYKEQTLQKREGSVQAFDHIERLDPQIPRRRLHKRAVIPAKRQEIYEDEPPVSPVIENIQEEQKINGYAISASTMLDQPGGFNTLKQMLGVQDPGFERQWHLINQEQRGHDLNVTGVWSQGITGKNVVVAILDDGLDMDSEDLKENYASFAEGSYDFNDQTPQPKPKLSDDTHGTRCAGEIAAVRNNVCGVGVAYEAKVAGIRILSSDITDADEAAALNYKYQDNHIYSCSWGPPDAGDVVEAPQGIVMDAIKEGIENGRNGSGTIFVFASGNGGTNDDNCNYDGYTNSLYTITVGAIDHVGNHPYYAERCAAQLVVTYSSGSGSSIYTTDVGSQTCTSKHGGTSAAAPLAAGIFALVLSVRPDLTWRDMQHLCVQTAVPISLEDNDWASLPSKRMYNHRFGYGKLDAYKIVEAAKTFKNVGPQTFLQLSTAPSEKANIADLTNINGSIDKSKALLSEITITQKMLDEAGLGRLEHVTATVNVEHGRRGDLEILLESPNDVVSQLGSPRKFDTSTDGLINWTFMSVKHWDENPVGTWKLRLVDGKNPQYTGKFVNWTLTLWGEVKPGFTGTPIHAPVKTTDKEAIATTSVTSSTTATISSGKFNSTSAGTNEDAASQNVEEEDNFFVYTLVALFVVVSFVGTTYIVRRHVAGPGSAADTTGYVSAPQRDEDEYEIDDLGRSAHARHSGDEGNEEDEEYEGASSQSPILNKIDPKGKGKMKGSHPLLNKNFKSYWFSAIKTTKTLPPILMASSSPSSTLDSRWATDYDRNKAESGVLSSYARRMKEDYDRSIIDYPKPNMHSGDHHANSDVPRNTARFHRNDDKHIPLEPKEEEKEENWAEKREPVNGSPRKPFEFSVDVQPWAPTSSIFAPSWTDDSATTSTPPGKEIAETASATDFDVPPLQNNNNYSIIEEQKDSEEIESNHNSHGSSSSPVDNAAVWTAWAKQEHDRHEKRH
ncbi:pheromone processing endoprotease [Apophysomyces ossiformis]|uniref:Pheromone processing endoprotease n=1 Tax=Apophysomyces ossiformis TaxID=679940 RepID=A0A8H7BZE4_9FUNG|nr:pheromone processing endoprotease [Apophysomyces ossiformis]